MDFVSLEIEHHQGAGFSFQHTDGPVTERGWEFSLGFVMSWLINSNSPQPSENSFYRIMRISSYVPSHFITYEDNNPRWLQSVSIKALLRK
jgi:hypothetical protein